MPHVEVDGCRLFYRFDGPADAPVVMMSNSLGTTHRMWDPQIPTLTRRFRVLRYDRRGHGQSDAPPGPYSIERLGRDAVGILDQLGLDRVNWCGLSIGGMVGMWLGVNAPARFERLVLSNTAARMAPPEAWDARRAWRR
jgi:3-oxoadipate enol-lactonase